MLRMGAAWLLSYPGLEGHEALILMRLLMKPRCTALLRGSFSACKDLWHACAGVLAEPLLIFLPCQDASRACYGRLRR